MRREAVLEEMAAVVSEKKESQDTEFLSKVELDPETILLGCARILYWLRVQSIQLRVRPVELKPSARVDAACIRLVESADFLGELVEIREGRLTFSEGLTLEQMRAMMLWAKENYRPPSHLRD